jgi:hypothetical protein
MKRFVALAALLAAAVGGCNTTMTAEDNTPSFMDQCLNTGTSMQECQRQRAYLLGHLPMPSIPDININVD